MKKFYTLLAGATLLLTGYAAHSQYATSGSGKYANRVFWLNWQYQGGEVGLQSVENSGGNDITSQFSNSGINLQEGTYTWVLAPNAVKVIGTVSNIAAINGSNPLLETHSTDKWSIDFTSMYGGLSGAPTVNGYRMKFDLSLDVQLSEDGGQTWNSVTYPGMVFADGEQLTGSRNESLSATASTEGAWELLEYFGNSTTYNINISNDNGSSTAKLTDDGGTGENHGAAVLFARGATSLTDISLNEDIQSNSAAAQAMALGLVMSIDHGDAPESYGEASQILTYFGEAAPLSPGNHTGHNSARDEIASNQTSTVYFGAITPDADGENYYSVNADGDNLNGVNDEDGVNINGLNVNSTQLPFMVSNGSDRQVTVAAWLDMDNLGYFDQNNRLSLNNSGRIAGNRLDQQTYANLPSPLKAGYYYARFRVGTGNNAPGPINAQINGEVEDYRIHIAGYTVNGQVINDHDGVDNGLSGTGVGVIGQSPVFVYLISEEGEILDKKLVGTDGSYSFTDVNIGDKIYVSTNAEATELSEISLPNGWDNSGQQNTDGSEVNSGYVTVNIEPGTPVEQAVTALNAVTNTSIDLLVEVDAAASVTSGTSTQVDIKVINGGPDAATGSTTVTYIVPEGFSFEGESGDQGDGWSIASDGSTITAVYTGISIESGAEFPVLKVPVKVDEDASGSTLVSNVKVAHPLDSDDSNNEASTSTEVLAPINTDLKVSVSTNGKMNIGGGNHFDITVSNDGPDATVSSTTIIETLPEGMSFDGEDGDQGNGWNITVDGQKITAVYTGRSIESGEDFPVLNIAVLVDESLGGTTVSNTVEVENPNDNNSTNNSATTPIEVGTDIATPIGFGDFTGQNQNGVNVLVWNTVTETNNKGFELQRSVDNGSSWTSVGFLAGKGTSTVSNNYRLEDAVGARYSSVLYRLIQVDNNGQKKVLDKIVHITNANQVGIRVYPNPANSYITVSCLATGSQVAIVNAAGQLMGRFTITTVDQRVNIDHLASGIYYLKSTDLTHETVSFIKK